MAVTKAQVLDGLRRIKRSGELANIVDIGLVSGVEIKAGNVTLTTNLPEDRAAGMAPLRAAVEQAAAEVYGVVTVTVQLTTKSASGANGAPHQSSHKPLAHA